VSHFQPGEFEPSRKLLRGRFEIRGDDRGDFDELVSPGGHIHFEMMDRDLLWVALEPRMAAGYSTKPSKRLTLWIRAVKGRLQITVADDQ
jgi:hypothetical protein